MGKKSIMKVHKTLAKQDLRAREKQFSQIMAEEYVERMEEAAKKRLVTVLVALRELDGYAKIRGDRLIDKVFEVEDRVSSGATPWDELLNKMLKDYGFREEDLDYYERRKDGTVKTPDREN